MSLDVGKIRCRHSRRDDGMVVGHLRRVEHSLRLFQRFALERSHQCLISSQSVKRGGTFGIYVVAQKLGINTGICREFFLIQALYDIERHLGTHRVFLVAIHLQRCQVVEMWRLLRSVFLLYVGHGEWFSRYLVEIFLSLLLAGKLALGGSENGIAIGCREHIIRLGLEVFYFLLPVYDKCERRCLHSSYTQHLTVLSVFQCI